MEKRKQFFFEKRTKKLLQMKQPTARRVRPISHPPPTTPNP
jgi:hypothetical protein